MKLLLHVGPNKAGSTLIQNFLKENANCLLDCGIWYRETDDYFASHHAVYTAIAAAETAKAVHLVERYVSDAIGMGCHTLVLSHENLWDLVRDSSAIAALKLALLENPVFDSVTTLVVSRAREPWFASYCFQLVRIGCLSNLQSLPARGGLYSLLADSLRFFSAYNLASIPLGQDILSNFLCVVDSSVDWTPLALVTDEDKYKNVSPPVGVMGDLILGLSSIVYSSMHPAEHINSASADSCRDGVLRAMDRNFSAISSISSELEGLIWSSFSGEAARNLSDDDAMILDKYGFVRDPSVMSYWVALFPIPEAACITLEDAGLHPWLDDGSAFPEADCLLLYDSPDQLISMAGVGHEAQALTARSLLHDYRRLLGWAEQTGQPLLSISQLQLQGPQLLQALFADGDAASPPSASPLPTIPPLLASVTLSLLDAEPDLLDCYLDLELRATLLGRDPDLRYRERLREASQDTEHLLQALLTSQRVQAAASELKQIVASRDMELKEMSEASEFSLLQLQQVQEELEHFRLADGEKQRQLEARNQELEELRIIKTCEDNAHQSELNALRQKLAELDQKVASRDTELKETIDAAEFTLLQLRQVQEELENYFLADGVKRRQLESLNQELEELRVTKLRQESLHHSELQALRVPMEQIIADLEQEAVSMESELKDTREAAALSLLQLHQVQEELECFLLADGEMQRQLETRVLQLEELRGLKTSQEIGHEVELNALRARLERQLAELEQHLSNKEKELQGQLEIQVLQLEESRELKTIQEIAHEMELNALRVRLERQLAELEQHLSNKEKELQESREAAEFSILQLHQVQEELENCYLNARASDQLAQAQFEQLKRAQRLMVRLHPDVLPTASYPPSLAVQVLPELAASTHNPTLQTEALLNTYAASLQRASALLERARRP